ncbi:GMC oxidoreductase [Myriangium duriaei CBS 260.36]|uniref:GMC oxidoreductase n=1 Tax=Myriangium duriaei CBS 260.36 TaxID=1168546 RepID=A0A9P4MPP4_9PEZI|nr:GMC oxidoreductase [Myriangium duriaei CBS 260.36]
MKETSALLKAIAVLSTTSLVYSLPQHSPREVQISQVKNSTYDYVIVGGGLSGLVVGNRLSANPANKVLVIEWGGIDTSVQATVPYNANGINSKSMWPLTSAPDAGLNNATFPVLVGGVVGGGTVVNGMAYNRAAADDYNAWEDLGNEGWGFNDLLPYFIKSTTLNTPSPAVAQEYSITWDRSAYDHGPVPATLTNFQFPDLKKFWQAWVEAGVPRPKEHGLGDAVGAFWMPSTIDVKRGVRGDARLEYYEPIKRRPNFHLLTKTTVNEILFQNGLTASGVSMTSRLDNTTSQVFASKEVILAAGAIHTPQILQLSGIGPKSVVEAAGIQSKLDLPGVGANFQDHPVAFMNFNISNQASPNSDSTLDPAYNASAYAQYLANRTGIYSSGRGNGVAFLSLPQITDDFDSIVSKVKAQNARDYLPSAYADPTLLAGFSAQRDILETRYGCSTTAVSEHPFSGGSGTWLGALQKPLSRGTITLNPVSPQGQPVIQYNTIQNPVDADLLIAIIRRIRKYWAADALKSLSPVETIPGAAVQTDDALLAALRGGLLQPSFAHPSGSCAMMPKEKGGVVGSDLLVYGTQRLSIIDASIIPLIPAAHLQASMYAVAEKAADIIKSR